MSSPAMQVRTRIPRIAEGPSRLASSHLRASAAKARLTVVPRRRRPTGRAPFLALVSMVLLAGVVGLLLFNTSMQQASFTTTALEQQAERLAARQQSLEMELDKLRDPQRIARSAQRLGMVQACSPAFLRLGSGKVEGAPCAADGATAFPLDPKPPVKPAILSPPARIVEVPAPNSADDTTTGNADGGVRDGKKKNNR